MNTLKEDFKVELSKVHRRWIRWPVTLLIYLFVALPLTIILYFIKAISESYKYFFKPCWKGPK